MRKKLRTLDRHPASSIARMIVLQHGYTGAVRQIKQIRDGAVGSLLDCDMEEYLVSMMTTFDIDLIEEYVARHCVRLAEFFGADEIAEGARQHPALRSSQ